MFSQTMESSDLTHWKKSSGRKLFQEIRADDCGVFQVDHSQQKYMRSFETLVEKNNSLLIPCQQLPRGAIVKFYRMQFGLRRVHSQNSRASQLQTARSGAFRQENRQCPSFSQRLPCNVAYELIIGRKWVIRILKQSAHPHSSKCVQISPVVFCCSTTTEDSLQSCVVITELRTDGTALSEMPLLDKHNTVVDRCDTRRIVGCAISLFGKASARHAPYPYLPQLNGFLPSTSRS